MKWGSVLYWLFIAALLSVVIGAPLILRSNAPAGASPLGRLVAPGPLSPAHAAIAGNCATCHTPVKGVEGKTCLGCHAGTDFGGKQSTRFHASVKECTSCHVEHDGGRSLARMNHEALRDPAIWLPAVRERAAAAHRATGGSPLNCASCHAFRDPHQGLFGTQCASCHGTSSWTIPGYRHPSVNSTQCAECHKAPPSHFMEHFSMVSQRAAGSKARVEQCFACHTTDSFNNIRRRGWYDHH